MVDISFIVVLFIACLCLQNASACLSDGGKSLWSGDHNSCVDISNISPETIVLTKRLFLEGLRSSILLREQYTIPDEDEDPIGSVYWHTWWTRSSSNDGPNLMDDVAAVMKQHNDDESVRECSTCAIYRCGPAMYWEIYDVASNASVYGGRLVLWPKRRGIIDWEDQKRRHSNVSQEEINYRGFLMLLLVAGAIMWLYCPKRNK